MIHLHILHVHAVYILHYTPGLQSVFYTDWGMLRYRGNGEVALSFSRQTIVTLIKHM